MFGGKKERASVSYGAVETVVGKGTQLQGKIKSDEAIRFDGAFQGEIDTTSDVIIGGDSTVTANVNAGKIRIAGLLHGNIRAERIEITASGRVYGDVKSRLLIVAEGGILQGQCEMERDASAVPAPEEEAEAQPQSL